MSYEHKGVSIAFNPTNAKFSATVGTKQLSAPSLDAIKKKIDSEQAVAFVPFKAVTLEDGKFVSFNVTHVEKGEERWNRGDMVFATDKPGSYGRLLHHATPDTPDNRVLLTAAHDAWVHAHEEERRLRALADEAKRAVPTVSAADYGVKK